MLAYVSIGIMPWLPQPLGLIVFVGGVALNVVAGVAMMFVLSRLERPISDFYWMRLLRPSGLVEALEFLGRPRVAAWAGRMLLAMGPAFLLSWGVGMS